ncbi:hsp90-like protein [Lasiosphaeria hispida]|uniref:Hsp90-like protein n=1 Tax=Lasiosphaeria hispida TaxID=260671 RepID=A0AAJ0MDE7_9PEZI|nr:hsp90-like protein [Lasiosphaeria hispida]
MPPKQTADIMTTASPQPVSETARERETFKYARYDDLGISTAKLQRPTTPPPYKPIPTSVLSSTPDPCLTAFAQLGLYRLGTTHSIVSLFDRTYQHFVAEAIRCAPLCPDGPPVPEGQVVLCGTAIPRATSLCEHVLTGPAEAAVVPGTAHGHHPINLPVSIIPDLNLDHRFCHIQDKYRRFYAGVPIRSPSGVNIGVYCVIDNKPRPGGLTPDQIQFIRDISKTVMDYLEAKRTSEYYRRGERMVRGLGSFVEGQATLSNWSDSPNKSFFQDIPGVREGILNKKLQEEEAPGQLPKAAKHNPSPTPCEDSAKPVNVASRPRGLSSVSVPREVKKPQHSSADQLQTDVERVFSKAANVIREAVEVEGVVFFDASVRSFGGLIGKEVSEPPILTRLPSGESSSDEGGVQPQGYTEQNICNVLGFSTSSSSSINSDKPPRNSVAIPERLLRRLLQRYHHGHIFNFETDGSILDNPSPEFEDVSPMSPWFTKTYFSTDVDGAKRTEFKRSRSRRDIASSLLKMFPGAKSVAFVPLFDGPKNRWFAGSFVWTKTPTRIFTVENELSYLRVFGLTTMAEVARLHTKSADKAKTDILGSISHELRSPLHGVVGAVELLRNTVLDRGQENILRTIETSGRTLLDTIDHLLDYSRISNQMRSKLDRSASSTDITKHQSNSPGPPSSASELPVHLDRLAEEVVESVFAGWSYRNRSDAHFAAWNTLLQRSSAGGSRHSKTSGIDEVQTEGPVPITPKPVQVLLNIEAANWSFKAHPGAFRRIVMNLLGNSLKFTNTGFIRINLHQETDLGSGRDYPVKTVVLTVSDSGKGIGEEYLRHRLFTPFSQEDPFAPGTGLGLSLVRQMAITLGGNINVVSRVNHGTTVTVSLPLPQDAAIAEEEPIFQQNIRALSDCTVILSGFETRIKLREGFRREDKKQRSQLKTMEAICRDWLQMEVIPELHNVSSPPPDFVIYNHKKTPDDSLEEMSGLARCPHVFLRQDSAAVYDLTTPKLGHSTEGVSFITQPIGPRKLADALVASRIRFQDASNHELLGLASSADQAFRPPDISSSIASPEIIGGLSSSPILSTGGLRTDLTPLGGILIKPELRFAEPPPEPLIAPVESGLLDELSESLRKDPAILIVDDNPINIKILVAYMTKLNHIHRTAMNGLEAVEMYTNAPEKYRCIVTDISMPIMDGLESTRRIREFERANKLEPAIVIALTGLSGAGIQQDAFVSGVDLFLTRPLGLKGLADALESAGVV